MTGSGGDGAILGTGDETARHLPADGTASRSPTQFLRIIVAATPISPRTPTFRGGVPRPFAGKHEELTPDPR